MLPISPHLVREMTLEAQIREKDGRGGFETSWQTVGTVRGVVAPLGARERLEAQQVQHTVTHRVYILPGGPVPEPGQRLVLEPGRYLQITGVTNPAEVGRVYVCEAEEGGGS